MRQPPQASGLPKIWQEATCADVLHIAQKPDAEGHRPNSQPKTQSASGIASSWAMQPLDASADPIRRAVSGHILGATTHLMRRVLEGADHRYVRLSSRPIGDAENKAHIVAVIDDVSEEERNRQVIERKGRLDALGQLTGGIAHDFNNLLASQLYAVELAKMSKTPERRQEFLDNVENSIASGRELTSRLLSFARKQPGLAKVSETRKTLHEFDRLVRPMLEANIALEFEVEDPDLRHFCDSTQLETAMMNLVLNARDAILRSGSGNRISIAARAVRGRAGETTEAQAMQGSGAIDAVSLRYVEISVTDNGPGMDAATLARCTDPFFTTKDTNSGTGLGLAMVYGFARQSDGDRKRPKLRLRNHGGPRQLNPALALEPVRVYDPAKDGPLDGDAGQITAIRVTRGGET